MRHSQWLRSRAGALFAIFLAAIGTAFSFSTSALGESDTTVDAVSGRAFGLQSFGLLDVDPTPEVILPASGGGPLTDELAEVDLSPLVTVGLLRVSTEGETGEGGFSESSATVADVRLLGSALDVVDPVLDLGGLLDDLLDLDEVLGGTGLLLEAVGSDCRSDADGSEGSTTIVGINAEGGVDPGNALTLGTGESLDINLSPLLRVVLNEQEVVDTGGVTSIVVNGARITLLGDDEDIDGDPDALLDVILARSECDAELDDATPPTPPPVLPGGATNDSDVSNSSDGTASIDTGDAAAVGNISETEISQEGVAEGHDAAVGQSAAVVNEGAASANTGDNAATGNNSTNTAVNDQTAVSEDGHGGASNESDVSNSSDGTASIDTGDAEAVGNISETEVDQSASVCGGYGSGVGQNAGVGNSGTAGANTGGNTATGNNSSNTAANGQTAVSTNGGGAHNSGTVSNSSGGTASIDTGDAAAVGNISSTEVEQSAEACGGSSDDDYWYDWHWGSSVGQSATVTNSGTASSNTGGNTATGNNSTNTASNSQTAVSGS